MGRLNRLWTKWNEEHFENQMVVPYIFLAEPRHPNALGAYHPLGSVGAPAEIRIRPSIVWGTHPILQTGDEFEEGRFRFAADVLLHEMIHQWQHEVRHNLEETQAGHGPLFRDRCNEIADRLRLGHVRTAKARGEDANLPSCSHWPHNVRDPKFYHDAFIKRDGFTPIGALCRATRKFASDPKSEKRVAELMTAAFLYAGRPLDGKWRR